MSLPAPRRLVVLRHGQTAFNAEGRVQGQLDVPLDALGLAQAAVAGAALRGLVGHIVSSDLARAICTAELVAAGTGIVARADPRLRELDLGEWQGHTTAEIAQRWPAQYLVWRQGEDLARGGGETYREAGARALACLTEALAGVEPGGTILAVTHGGTARAALGELLSLPTESWWSLAPLGNTCWSVLVEGERGWRLERHNVGPGPAVGPVPGAHDLGARPTGRGRAAQPVK